MDIDKQELQALFEMLASQTGEELNHKGFKEIESKTEFRLSQKYLYTKYHESKDPSLTSISIQDVKLKDLVNFLGFENYSEFRQYYKNPISDILKSCEGTWVSFVRQNSHEGILFKSPVLIQEENKKMIYKLRGPHSTFEGEITYANSCLFTLFKGLNGKQFHHAYKVGNRANPRILQGIYSGISTAGDPIGGRTILCRSDQAFDSIQNEKLLIEELSKSQDRFEKGLANYMQHYEKNNLRLNPIVSFDVEDLYS